MFGQLEFGLTGTVLGLTFGLGQIKANLKQLALPGLRLLMWFRLPVPYNGGLNPAGTRRKFVSLKFGNAGYGIPKVKDGSGRIWHSLFSTCQSNMMARVMTSLVMSYLRIEPTVTLDSDSRFSRYALFMFALGSDSRFSRHPPTHILHGRRETCS